MSPLNRDILEARIRLDLVNFLARSGSKQKFNSSRLARLDKKKARLGSAREKTGSTQPYYPPLNLFPNFSTEYVL